MEQVKDFEFKLPYLDYNFSSIKNDKSIIKPISISFPNYRLQQMLESHCNPIYIKRMPSLLVILKYDVNQLQTIASIIKAVQSCITEPVYLTEAYPWNCLDIDNLEKNIVNESFNNLNDSFVYNPSKRNTICSLFLKNLNFFELAILERVSTQFIEPVYDHLHSAYEYKKRELFKHFDLKQFLMEIDEHYNLNPITIYELRFIFKHFGHHMEEINIQLEYIKVNVKLNDTIIRYIIDTITDMIEEFTEKDKLQSIHIHKVIIKDKNMKSLIKLTKENVENPIRYADEKLLNPEKYVSFKEAIQCYDMQTNLHLIDYDCFFYLFIRKNIFELKLLTDYPHLEIERLFMVDFLNNIKLERLDIQCNNDSENKNCDDLLNALVKNSSDSLKSVQIKSCHTQNVFRLLSKFKNLEEITIDNCKIDDMYDIKLFTFKNLRILNMPKYKSINDGICWDIYQQNKSLEYLDISESNVTGEFLEAVNLIHNSCKLIIQITGSIAGFLHKRGEISITNDKLSVRNTTLEYFHESEKNEILQNFNNDIDTESSDFFTTFLSKKLQKSFMEKLSSYFMFLVLNFNEYWHLNHNCLNYMTKLKKINSLYLCTHYPMLSNQMEIKNLSHCKIIRLSITGYDKIDKESPKNSSAYIFEALTEKSNYLNNLELTDCSINNQFVDALNQCINLKELKLTNINGFSLPDFDKLSLPQLKSLEISNIIDFDDTVCYDIVKNSPKMNKLNITKCKSFNGTCFKSIDNLSHEERLLNVHVYRAPAVISYLKNEIKVKNISVTVGYNDSFYMFVSLLNDELQPNIKLEFLNLITSLDLKSHSVHMNKYNMHFDNNFFSNVYNLYKLKLLTIESFYPLVDYKLLTLYKLNIKYLYLENDNIREIDMSCHILEDFATFNPNNLTDISLTKCKINELAILSINNMSNLRSLTLESVEFINYEHGYIKQLFVENMDELKIMDNDQFTDEACITIIINNLNLTKMDLLKCKNISEHCFIELQNIGIRRQKQLKIDINHTLAGYYCLFNEINLSECNILLKDTPYSEANLFYLEQVFAKKFHLISLPRELLIRFSQSYTLDLTKLNALDDLSFDFVSQIKYIKGLKICSYYKNVKNRKKMISNLIKTKIRVLKIVGNEDNNSDCHDIIEEYQIADNLEHIELINCNITAELIEDFQRFSFLQTIVIFNDNKNYLKKVITSFNFQGSSVYKFTVNDKIIENNSESIKMLLMECSK